MILKVQPSSLRLTIHYGKRKFGHALLLGGGVAFHYFQPGRSLELEWKHRASELKETNNPKLDARTSLLKELAELPLESYTELLEDVKFLNNQGRSIEPRGDNLMLCTEGQRLRFVDIGKLVDDNHMGAVSHLLTGFYTHDSSFRMPLIPKEEDYLVAINKKLKTANIGVGLPATEAEASQRKQIERFAFKDKSRIEGISQLRMTALLPELRDKLAQINRYLVERY